MKFDIVTIFPNFFDSFKGEALIARALKKKIISITAHNLRSYSNDKRGTVDDRPYGGGAGMVLMFEPIYKAVIKIKKRNVSSRIIAFNPKGKKFNENMAQRLSKYDQLIFICGRYEGIDERVMREIANEEISIGDYVLFGGEVPAMVVMESVTRLIPGAIAKQESVENESFRDVKGIGKEQLTKYIEYPHYTRPEVISVDKKKLRVPKVLLSGNHKKIDEWRNKHSK
ncbi:MAG: tRNA (guanosine(37)-N1)-methyltransferase TrmD [Candidatus Yanofskybacteria bacterium RIFCSPLOWO2_12_FULL_44_13b]|nr:MAG: tRNA (guanosine(37)-N1)-methyltransferase TrmD [Candidatus Yanofskybacteria bacterium RIFCSPHIGHO2_01_FULL_44_110b]OGN18834.1 MAG: tRNA (guanosine(37)-N1)-methyltransferase TrmD [Candidatus Yanofskybacteria bacterium RIFCSPHIGHO2_12_FULL_44_29b]OGN25668.1 MAG: tRNA (guanosine(37)-N1)-methyltransferase TrmD [Candidatus Yanofskybacteria bacterium RIFCSPLOWO2_01_FULL_44_88]OGN31484.1 MAG: tRNA (guanosine(37)-N1)-methyltransferase TrmD [Candidatus Yanofskybacteria bacterium RIFCSPLOWO2_02_FU